MSIYYSTSFVMQSTSSLKMIRARTTEKSRVFVLVSGLLLVGEGVGESISRRNRFFSLSYCCCLYSCVWFVCFGRKKRERGIGLPVMMGEGVTVL